MEAMIRRAYSQTVQLYPSVALTKLRSMTLVGGLSLCWILPQEWPTRAVFCGCWLACAWHMANLHKRSRVIKGLSFGDSGFEVWVETARGEIGKFPARCYRAPFIHHRLVILYLASERQRWVLPILWDAADAASLRQLRVWLVCKSCRAE